jgi:hypothetical protein
MLPLSGQIAYKFPGMPAFDKGKGNAASIPDRVRTSGMVPPVP